MLFLREAPNQRNKILTLYMWNYYFSAEQNHARSVGYNTSHGYRHQNTENKAVDSTVLLTDAIKCQKIIVFAVDTEWTVYLWYLKKESSSTHRRSRNFYCDPLVLGESWFIWIRFSNSQSSYNKLSCREYDLNFERDYGFTFNNVLINDCRKDSWQEIIGLGSLIEQEFGIIGNEI
jgi:hypothetical protein